jgi:hypothetical protein
MNIILTLTEDKANGYNTLLPIDKARLAQPPAKTITSRYIGLEERGSFNL